MKPNAQDATLRNTRAARSAEQKLLARIKKLESAVKQLQRELKETRQLVNDIEAG